MEQVIEQGENPVEQLLDWVRTDVRDLAREGLFVVLQETSDVGRNPSRPPTTNRHALTRRAAAVPSAVDQPSPKAI